MHHAVREVQPASRDIAVGLASSQRFVLVLGTVERRKNVEAAVQALSALPGDVALVIAGPAGNGERDLQRAITESPVAERIVRLSQISAAEHAALIRHTTVLCFPSFYEGFGLPPLEALRVSTPVVATAVGALPELIGDRVDLVRPGDTVALTEMLAAAVESFIVDQNIVDRISQMTWTQTASQMADVYRRVAEANG